MAIQGNLQDMSVADLIQHTCQDGKAARLTINQENREAILYFKDGQLFHATLDDLTGEEVVYRIINWQEGQFTLTNLSPTDNVPTTIQRSWSGILLEAARQLDEAQQTEQIEQTIEQHLIQEKIPVAKKKSELLAEALEKLLQESSDINGAAIVGVDGLVYSANVPQRVLDENMVGASSAAIIGLSKRAVEQLKRGNFKRTLIQGDDGNIIVISLTDDTLFVGLTPSNINLGMAFAEVRSIADELREIL